MELQHNDTAKDILARLSGGDKQVDIVLRSGKNYNGVVQTVGEHYVSIKQTGNRSFFDALIRIEDIAAVEVKVRN